MTEGSFCIKMLISKEVFCWIESCWGVGAIPYNAPVWEILAEQAFQEKTSILSENPTCPFCVRLVGQSGAGKTSQLLPAVKEASVTNGIPFISFAVRDFVKYHPDLEKIVQTYGESLLREKTNMFALTLLTEVLLRCISKKLPILLEVTLLAPVYEACIHAFLIKNGYHCDYQCLAIPKSVSDAWIQKRFLETKRVVSQNSSSFFYDTLEPAFKALQGIALKNRVFIWDRVHEMPSISDFQDAKLYDKIEDARRLKGPFLSPEAGIASKTKFLCDFYRKHSPI
ncbi:MAG: zeta toxin family protein [bacterium]